MRERASHRQIYLDERASHGQIYLMREPVMDRSLPYEREPAMDRSTL